MLGHHPNWPSLKAIPPVADGDHFSGCDKALAIRSGRRSVTAQPEGRQDSILTTEGLNGIY